MHFLCGEVMVVVEVDFGEEFNSFEAVLRLGGGCRGWSVWRGLLGILRPFRGGFAFAF